jgi:DedD protein
MADRDDARPEFNPKHRIVGAIIIVALVVIFVPMILSERQPPSEAGSGAETAAHNEIANTRVVVTPVVADQPAAAETSETTTKTVTLPADEPAAKPEVKPVVPAEHPAPAKQTPSAPAKEKIAKATAAVEKITKGWVVQVGTFSNTENAIRLRDKLKSHEHTVHTETVTVAGKKAMRLRVGPFRDKEQAEYAQSRIRRETGVQGAVLAYP